MQHNLGWALKLSVQLLPGLVVAVSEYVELSGTFSPLAIYWPLDLLDFNQGNSPRPNLDRPEKSIIQYFGRDELSQK